MSAGWWILFAVVVLLAVMPSAEDREEARRIDKIWEAQEKAKEATHGRD